MSTNTLAPPDLVTMGDFNGDGLFNNADLQGMISALANGGGAGGLSVVPEPTSAVLLVLGGLVFLQRARLPRRAGLKQDEKN